MSIIAYDAGLEDGRFEILQQVLDLLDKMAENPPMRGDIALSDLRRLIKELN
ncbi:hypothetical protein UFOVP115_55 [uncultured Caudovirales phage]|uniref:Uncharacterized protein n=1 Tax=uncultured Caudovirales phage TaxID=2100421 RepID=A0A6J5L5I3_9CAUD|nr:hypothetical protein UFOVP115_55 [uncultured Caudovirales phage]